MNAMNQPDEGYALQNIESRDTGMTSTPSDALPIVSTASRDLALYIGAFFDELIRAGVCDVVISPGSRSTPLAMIAYEAHARFGASFNLYVDVDERGASFFALGLAKASGRAVALICTSGTAVANYYPAVMEAESSRVPLIVLSGDRPARLQKLGAPQTCDQDKIFSDHVRKFYRLPQPSADEKAIAHVRQVARELYVGALPGTHASAPVHANFPFDEPLVPLIDEDDLFSVGRIEGHDMLPSVVVADRSLPAKDAGKLAEYLDKHRVIVLVGEGVFSCAAVRDHARRDREAQALLAFSERFDAPLLADPLSQLRAYGHPAVICGYDAIVKAHMTPEFDVVIRFGRYPVSKRMAQLIEQQRPVQLVVDAVESRDFNAQTTTFIAADPLDFVAAMLEAVSYDFEEVPDEACTLPESIQKWGLLDRERMERLLASDLTLNDSFEGAYVQTLLDILPSEALLFSANSMAIRIVDSFAFKRGKRITVLANRGLNGIDGTVSTALGAAQEFKQTVFLTGDLTLLHDLNALALQGEMMLREKDGATRPSIVIVLLNNQGGAIFDMLPQQSSHPYFERLFLTPQQVDFTQAASAFGVPAQTVKTLDEFRAACEEHFGIPGISIIEVPVALTGVKERYDRY